MTEAGFVSELVVSASATIGDDKLDATNTESATVPIIFDFFLFIFFSYPPFMFSVTRMASGYLTVWKFKNKTL
jgi:hypothetical protein